MTSPEWRWYEPQHAVLGGKDYFTHAWGSIYVLSGKAASTIAQLPANSMRYFANEGKAAHHEFADSLLHVAICL